jgi:hypothetical protein
VDAQWWGLEPEDDVDFCFVSSSALGFYVSLNSLFLSVTAGKRHTGPPSTRFPELTPLPTPSGKPQLPLFLRPAPKMKVKLKLHAAVSKHQQSKGVNGPGNAVITASADSPPATK